MDAEEVEPVQVLAQKGIKEVPPCFVQPLQHRPGFRSSQSTLQIPIIDLHPLSAGHAYPSYQAQLSKLAHACEEWGFFQIVNHGVGEEVMKDMKRVVRGFFELPWEVKRRWSMRDGGHIGYAAHFSSADKDTSDWVDLLAHYFAPDSLKLAGLQQTPTLPLDYRSYYPNCVASFVKPLGCQEITLKQNVESIHYCFEIIVIHHVRNQIEC